MTNPTLHTVSGADEKPSRRGFLTLLTGAVVALSAAVTGGLSFLFMRPRVTYGPPARVPIGKPELYTSGNQVSLQEAKIVIRRRGDKIAAISTICTHLGCTVNPSDTGFDCPCHGSTYDEQGSVTGGPAPAALSWFRVKQTPSGELVVDKHEVVPADTYLEIKA